VPSADTDPAPARLGPRFTRLWTAATVSNVGDGLLVAALPLLAVQVTDSPLLVAGLTFCRGVPWLLFGLSAGVIVDRTDRRRLMAFVDYGRGAVVAALGVAVIVSDVPIWVLYVVALGLGIGEVLFDSAAGAFLPMVVPDEFLERANSRMYLSLTIANELSGPAAGAWLFAAASAAPFLIDAGSFVFAATLVSTITGTFRAENSPESGGTSGAEPGPDSASDTGANSMSMRARIREGLQFVRGHSLLRTLAIVGAGYNFLATGLEAVAVLYITSELGASKAQYGLVLTLAALGGLTGGFLAERIFARFQSGRVIIVDVVVCAIFAFGAAAIGTLWAWTVFDIVLFGGSAIASIGSQSMRQRVMPRHLAGRVTSVFLIALFGAGPLGAAAFGVLTTMTSLTAALIAFGVGAIGLMAGFGRSLLAETSQPIAS
jgi:MFS family permease